MVQFKGSDRANFEKIIMKLHYTLLFTGNFEIYIDSSLNEISKLAPAALEVKEISKTF